MKAVILAGGEGVRLRPLTCCRPKPMLEILGKPVLEYTLEHLKNHGVQEVFLTLQYLPQTIMEYFGEEYQGMRLHFCLEDVPLGTAGCVKQLAEELDETFMVISGDALTDADISEAVALHREKKAEATLILKQVDTPVEYGIVTLNDQGMVQRFQEKPGWNEVFSNLANTGIYILEPSVLADIHGEGMCDFSKDVFPKILEQERGIAGYVTPGYWCDIGSHEDYLAAQFDLLEGRCALPAPGKIQNGVMIAPDVQLEGDVQITPPCWIGSDCHIASGAVLGPRAVLGCGSRVERGAGMKNSMTGQNCVLGSRSQLRGAIVGEKCHVKAGVELYEGCAVGDGAMIGAFSKLLSGSRVWPGKQVEDFSHIQGAVRWGSTALRHPWINGCLRAEDWSELPPERIFAWGSAAAAACGDQPLVISDDGSERARTVRTAFQAGAACAGAAIQPLAHANLPMHRFMQRMLGMTLGIHVAEREGGFALHFLGKDGKNLSAALEKKVENALRRGVEPTSAPSALAPELEVEALYLAHLKALVSPEIKGTSVVVFCQEPEMLAWAARMLRALGYQVMLSSKAPEPDRKVPSGEYRARMLEANAGLGLRLEADEYQLVDYQGKIYRDWMLEALLESAEPQKEIRCRLLGDGVLAAAWMYGICGGDLERYVKTHPLPERWEKQIPCPWSERGKMAATMDGWREFVRKPDGSRCRKDGRIAITPREDRPLIRLTAQNVSQEMAQEILGEYEKKLMEQLRR